MLSRLYVLILLFLTEHPGGVSALVAGMVSACEKVLGLLFGVLNNRFNLKNVNIGYFAKFLEENWEFSAELIFIGFHI